MPLFEVAVLMKPTKKEAEEEGKSDQLVFGPKAVAARDAQGAAIIATQGEEALKGVDLGRAEVLVRPF